MSDYPAPRASRRRRIDAGRADPVTVAVATEGVDLISVAAPIAPAAPVESPAYRVGLKEMAADERPRERLTLRGSQALTNHELLAILFGTGMAGESVLDYSQRLLTECGGLAGLARADVRELATLRGVGPARATMLRAVFELASRVAALAPDQRPRIASPDDVINLVGVEMAALPQEQLRLVLLDTKHQVLAIRTVYQGTVNGANVRLAEVFREAIRHNAVAMIVVHNHPSGDPTPSGADAAVTRDLVQGGELLGIDVLDHLVIGQGRHASMRRLALGFPAKA